MSFGSGLTCLVAFMTARRISKLDRCYREFLQDQDAARFIDAVSAEYSLGTLARLTSHDAATSRRAAVLAVGMLGGMESNECLGRALQDADRGVRLTADSVIRQVWLRHEDSALEHELQILIRYNATGRFLPVIDRATRLLECHCDLPELRNQRAVAFFGLSDFLSSVDDAQVVLRENSFHFGAAMGIGRCYLALDRPELALRFFRRALEINPTLDGLRCTIRRLEKSLRP